MTASLNGHSDIVKILIEAQAQVNMQENEVLSLYNNTDCISMFVFIILE